jgi:hypothetical protein
LSNFSYHPYEMKTPGRRRCSLVMKTVGACFVAEGPLSRNTFERSTYKQTQREGTRRSYDPRSFDIVTCRETKGSTDLKRKRPLSP